MTKIAKILKKKTLIEGHTALLPLDVYNMKALVIITVGKFRPYLLPRNANYFKILIFLVTFITM